MSDRRSRNRRHPRGPGYDPRPITPRPSSPTIDDEGFGLDLPASLRGSVPAVALLPLRFFLGGMFLYAGLDKLLDPRFLASSGPGSIAQQLEGFARVSPLSPLVTVIAEPFPILVGVGIALLEIAIGIGTILGLLYRWSAIAGAGLSLLFFLTASWTTRPYYLGPDLPYALAWTTLAAAGSGGVLTVEDWLARRDERLAAANPHWSRAWDEESDPGRRVVLQLGALGVAAIGFATLGRFLERAAPVSAAGGDDGSGPSSASSVATATPGAPTAMPGGDASAAPEASVAPGAADTTGGTLLGSISQLPVGRAARFQDASTGDPGIIVHLKDGSVAAFDAVCTHAGCTVGFDRSSGLIVCPCHGAAFDPADHAAVVAGPTNIPLPELPIRIDKASGRIYLMG